MEVKKLAVEIYKGYHFSEIGLQDSIPKRINFFSKTKGIKTYFYPYETHVNNILGTYNIFLNEKLRDDQLWKEFLLSFIIIHITKLCDKQNKTISQTKLLSLSKEIKKEISLLLNERKEVKV